jgi:hypothetical protein
MNALANSQLGELQKFLTIGYPDGQPPVRFGRYTGQESPEARKQLIANPPDILLTNYVMLELVLTRPRERGLVEAAKGLWFLILDELPDDRSGGPSSPRIGRGDLLLANLSSFVLDYVARQKIAGTSMTFFIVKQLPVLPPAAYRTPVAWLAEATPTDWIRRRVLELSYTAYDLTSFAADLGDKGLPFQWDEGRRFAMRCELDAAYFHLYRIERDDVNYIMDSFRAFQNNDRPRFERTKALILEIYDAMTEAAQTGKPYQTILDPPPGQGPRHG